MQDYSKYIVHTYGKGLETDLRKNKTVKLNERDCNIIYADTDKMEAVYNQEDNTDEDENILLKQKKLERENMNYLGKTITVPEPFNLTHKDKLTIQEKKLLETYIQ